MPERQEKNCLNTFMFQSNHFLRCFSCISILSVAYLTKISIKMNLIYMHEKLSYGSNCTGPTTKQLHQPTNCTKLILQFEVQDMKYQLHKVSLNPKMKIFYEYTVPPGPNQTDSNILY